MKDLKKFVKSLKKYKEKDTLDEKDYLKRLILKERKNNKKISIDDLAKRFYYSEKDIQKIVDEIDLEETEKNEKKQIKPKKRFKFKEKIKLKDKLLDKEDKNTLKDIFLKILLFGVPLNFSLWCFFFHPFSWFSWLAYGYTFWFLKKELVNILRSFWFR